MVHANIRRLIRKSRDIITLHVATERNKFGVDLRISMSWYIKNYSYHTNNK